MIKLIFIMFAFFWGYKIYLSKGSRRLQWLISGILLFPSSITVIDFFVFKTFHSFLVTSFLMSIIVQDKSFVKQYKAFPLKWSLLLLLFSHFGVGFFDERLNLQLKITKPIYAFLLSYGVIFLSYTSLRSLREWGELRRYLVYLSLFMCMYGFLNFVLRINPYDSLISATYKVPSFFSQYLRNDTRFRINSFVAHPIAYGYTLSVLILIIFFVRTKIKPKGIIVLTIIFLLSNLILTNSRTPLFACFISFLIVLLFYYKLKKIVSYLLGFFLLSFLSYLFIPEFKNKVDITLDVFITGGVKTQGSNVQMREIQFFASLAEFYKKPIWGHGYDYIVEDLGWSADADKLSSEEDFAGFESYGYKLLIEEGGVQIITILLFYISLFSFFLLNRRCLSGKKNIYSSLGIGVVTSFLVFIFSTGVLGTWIITMVMLGVLIKSVQLNKIN